MDMLTHDLRRALLLAKVGGEGDDILYKGEWLTIRAMRRRSGQLPARQWRDGLDKVGLAKFLSAAANVENSLHSNRPAAGGRTDPVKGSRMGLHELRVTPPGKKGGPHLRVLYIRRGRTLWAANGFTKQKNKLERKDVNAAETIVKEWEEWLEGGGR